MFLSHLCHRIYSILLGSVRYYSCTNTQTMIECNNPNLMNHHHHHYNTTISTAYDNSEETSSNPPVSHPSSNPYSNISAKRSYPHSSPKLSNSQSPPAPTSSSGPGSASPSVMWEDTSPDETLARQSWVPSVPRRGRRVRIRLSRGSLAGVSSVWSWRRSGLGYKNGRIGWCWVPSMGYCWLYWVLWGI